MREGGREGGREGSRLHEELYQEVNRHTFARVHTCVRVHTHVSSVLVYLSVRGVTVNMSCIRKRGMELSGWCTCLRHLTWTLDLRTGE